jgi:hypothetical protein
MVANLLQDVRYALHGFALRPTGEPLRNCGLGATFYLRTTPAALLAAVPRVE